MLRRCPEGARDFSPTCSEAECGVWERYRQGSSERTMQIQTMIYNAIHIIRSSFQDFLTDIILNPTFSHIPPHSASLHVGLKSLAPSGHLRNISSNYQLLTTN
ncbi:hypothetical protein Barb4_01544 [Bacteroidales bacterium Barb4]|nr:hypothetical protein Barb4_01544 [Bacteroidales bacterium Barb4]